jgi:hypothetical protein
MKSAAMSLQSRVQLHADTGIETGTCGAITAQKPV